ncbi:O-antigen ligase family protein, partial [Patescibacteria group bacterium]
IICILDLTIQILDTIPMTLDTFFKKTIYYTFFALFVLTPLIWTAKMSELFEFPKMLFVYACTAVIATAWISRMIIQKQVLINKTYLDLPIFLFLLSQLISTLISIDKHTSIFGYYTRFHGGLLSTISYIALYYAFVSNITKDKAKMLLSSILYGAVAASLYAFPEHFGISPSCKVIGSGWIATCWVQDVVTRVFGTFGQPNWLAAYLITLIFIPLAFLLNKSKKKNFFESSLTWTKAIKAKKKKSQKQSSTKKLILWKLVFLLFLSVLIFTKSRSGILGFAIGMSIFSFLSLVSSRTKKKTITILSGSFLFIFIVYFLWGKGTVPQVDKYLFPAKKTSATQSATLVQETPKPKVGTVLDTGGTESGDIRRIVWQGALEVWKNNPLFGTGVETFAYSYYNHRPAEHNLTSEWDFLYNKAHNEWLNHLANSGAFGLGSYLIFMAFFFIWLIKNNSPLNTAVISGSIALAISNFFGFSTVPVGVLFFILPAVTLSLSSQTEPIADDYEEDEEMSSGQSFMLFIALIIGLILIYKNFRIYSADRAYAKGKAANDADQVQLALESLEKAIKISPKEPVYKDEFAQAATNAALYFYEQKQASAASQIATLAVGASTQAVNQNKVHLNFIKTRARMLANFGNFKPELLEESETTMKQAIRLAPTDAKLYFSLGLIQLQLEKFEASNTNFQQAIDLKPDYEIARFTYAEFLASQNQIEKAIEQYQYILDHISPNNSKVLEALEKLN